MNEFFNSVFQNAAEYPGNRANQARSAPRPGPNAQRFMRHEQSQVNFDPPQSGCTPPASQRSIRQIPTVAVTPEDLFDENNRSCCICFEE